MASIFRLQHGERWQIDGVNMRFECEFGDQTLYFVVERTLAPFQITAPDGSRRPPDYDWALDAFAEGRLRRLPTLAEQAQARARREAAAREYGPDEIAALDPRARLRLFVLRGFDAMGQFSLSPKAIGLGLGELWHANPEKALEFGAPPSPKSVQRWMVERGIPGERPIRQMLSMSGRVGRPRRRPAITHRALDNGALWYWSTPRASIRDAYARLAVRFLRLNRWRQRAGFAWLRVPARETFRLRVRAFECFETCAAKWGKKRARARFKGIGEGLRASKFLELGCMDHTQLDAVIIDADHMLPIGRPTLTVLIDVRTRCIVGFVVSYEPPSLYLVIECIKRANRPKRHLLQRKPGFPVLSEIYGRFDTIVVDNGMEFAGKSFADSLIDMGSSVQWAPVGEPTYKAVVERFFGILNNLLNHKLPGGVLKPELLRELEYDPSKDAVLTTEELEDLIWEALCYYHIEEHSELGRPPADLWEQDSKSGIPIIGDDRLLDKLLGKVVGRKLTRSGIELLGLRYHDQRITEGLLADLIALEPVRTQRKGSATASVKVKYNPENLAEIHVWNQRRNQYETLPCTDRTYASGVTEWQHNKLQGWVRKQGLAFSSEVDRLTARATLVAKIQQASPALLSKQRRAQMRLKKSPAIAALQGNGVVLAYAPARHDGMAPVIVNDTLSTERLDGNRLPTRPPRGSSKTRRKIRPPAASTNVEFPESDEDLLPPHSKGGGK